MLVVRYGKTSAGSALRALHDWIASVSHLDGFSALLDQVATEKKVMYCTIRTLFDVV
jgi:hypothetical protein